MCINIIVDFGQRLIFVYYKYNVIDRSDERCIIRVRMCASAKLIITTTCCWLSAHIGSGNYGCLIMSQDCMKQEDLWNQDEVFWNGQKCQWKRV